MIEPNDRSQPGVYITESNAFPPAVVGVPTSVSAFIGYTAKAQTNGKPCFNQPIKVSSMAEFESYFGGRYDPVYNIKQQTDPKDNNYDFKVSYAGVPPLDSSAPPVGSYLYYYLEQAGASQFNLYDSMRLFYANGGETCYVVSVGDYSKGAINKDDLIRGLNVIAEQTGITMLVIPDAVSLEGQSYASSAAASQSAFKPSPAFQDVVRAMLNQCGKQNDRVAILDVYGTTYVNSNATLDAVISQFREDAGGESLNYAVAYFPFVVTTLVQASDFTYQNFQPLSLLQSILGWENHNLYYATDQSTYQAVQKSISKMVASPVSTDESTLEQNADQAKALTKTLASAIPLLADILDIVVLKNSVMPPSGAMAGVYTYIDSSRGIWNAPANIALNNVARTTYKLNDDQQGDLNVPLDGKAVNAIREFAGRGNVVWGARTLDGNSNDWRYIQARRTIIYIEQSIKNSLAPFTFAANDGNTWVAVTSMVSNFLQGLWSQGALMGAKATEAFTVQCGLGSTMTPTDLLEGYMVVQVALQMIRPAEFIELTFKQKMEGLS